MMVLPFTGDAVVVCLSHFRDMDVKLDTRELSAAVSSDVSLVRVTMICHVKYFSRFTSHVLQETVTSRVL